MIGCRCDLKVEQEQGHSALTNIEKTKADTAVSSAYKTANPICSHPLLVDVERNQSPVHDRESDHEPLLSTGGAERGISNIRWLQWPR